MSAQAVQPPVWSAEELAAAREVAKKIAVMERHGEGPDAFYETCERVRNEIQRALDQTNCLRALDGESFRASPDLWHVLRYFCAPPISEEDLWTLVGQIFQRVPLTAGNRVAETFTALLDKKRFPWITLERAPTDDELAIAVAGTVTLLAHERLKTEKRKASSRAQENAVSEALSTAGWSLDESRTAITDLDMLKRGSFSKERKVAGIKCDVPVRLHDGRLLALECKVSNGPKNSWKRLGREIGGKAERWKEVFGSRVMTGAILSGVYDMKNLLSAQDEQRVFLFWEHDLRPLVDFIRDAK